MSFTFFQKVLELIKQISEGRVSTYSDIARAHGNPWAARAVGNALNKNPYLVTVPCHRVVRSNGCIGGYVDGVEKKISFFEREGITIIRGKVIDFEERRFKFQN